MGTENLNPFRTEDEAREKGRQGGIKSGEARRRKRDMKERLKILLELQTQEGEAYDIENANNLLEVQGKPVTVADAILISQIVKASKGDTRAAEFVRDTSGNKPIDVLEVNTDKSDGLIEMEQYLYGEPSDTENAQN